MDKFVNGIAVGIAIGALILFIAALNDPNYQKGSGEQIKHCEKELPRDRKCALVAVVESLE